MNLSKQRKVFHMNFTKAISIIALTLFFTAVATQPTFAHDEIGVMVNNQRINFAGQSPVIADSRVLVPIRGVFEHLGFDVNWNDEAQQAILSNNHHTVIITLESDVFTVNDTSLNLDVPAQNIGGSTMLPIRAVLESVGYHLDWTANTRTVLISQQPIVLPPVNFRSWVTNFTFLDNMFVQFASEDYIWAKSGRILHKSANHGQSWQRVYEFASQIETVYVDDAGNIFVATSLGRGLQNASTELFRSTDGGDSFIKVLDIISGAPFHWNIASRNGTIFVSEYGYKGPSGNNARRIYRSLDYGSTWQIVFEPPAAREWHNHKLLLAGEFVYQSIGDHPHQRIIRSGDNGDTWEIVNRRIHPISAVVLDDYILWGLDGGGFYGCGIARYNRTTGLIASVWNPPRPFMGSVYDMMKVNGVIYAMFLSYEGSRHPASVFFSRDEGVTWQLMGYIAKDAHEGVGLWRITNDGVFGYIFMQVPFHLENGVRQNTWTTLRFELL